MALALVQDGDQTGFAGDDGLGFGGKGIAKVGLAVVVIIIIVVVVIIKIILRGVPWLAFLVVVAVFVLVVGFFQDGRRIPQDLRG